ncbi:hypothetical protein [Stenotrophomonas indicatrix]|uniref:hypothetical protein n=1 Tax=Stenotrophomonas indicatrix TaxID=2045451 RepID=UPI000739544D|nr:hypothetical protein [Stenotrophomonas indicatrix]CRD54391.1 hypothetical protein BN1263460217 [Stenotrophomonas indicatrix]
MARALQAPSPPSAAQRALKAEQPDAPPDPALLLRRHRLAAALALLARAIYTGAASFLLPCAAGIAYFTWCGVRDLVRNWPAFRKEMQERAAERQRTPMPADDTH